MASVILLITLPKSFKNGSSVFIADIHDPSGTVNPKDPSGGTGGFFIVLQIYYKVIKKSYLLTDHCQRMEITSHLLIFLLTLKISPTILLHYENG